MIAGFFASALLALGVALIDAGAYLLAFPRLPGAMVAPMGWGLAVLIALNLILMGYAKVRALPFPRSTTGSFGPVCGSPATGSDATRRPPPPAPSASPPLPRPSRPSSTRSSS